jgi:hypothetical protein
MVKQNGAFREDYYRGMLIKAKELGFAFQTFSEYLDNPSKKVIMIRHDIDVSLEWALELAQIEYDLGICSTYFVRVHSTRYNLFDQHNYRRLHKLKNMGFEIGVHQEVCNFCNTRDEAILLLKREKTVVESILGCHIRGVATHIPKSSLLKITQEVLEETLFDYTPGGEIFNEGAIFVSDSNCHWKQYSFERAILLSDKVLANIHPVWWLGKVENQLELIQFLKEGN